MSRVVRTRVMLRSSPPEGAFTPDANEALRANDLHVKSMQRCNRQSCGAIRANYAARITRRKWSVWGI